LVRLAATLLLLLSTSLFADSADLAILQMPDNDRPLYMDFRIQNLGPDTAKNVRLLIDVPPPLEVHHIQTNIGTCVKTPPVQCTIFDLAAGLDGYVLVQLLPPYVDATHTVTATVSSATPDPAAANNVVTRTFVTRMEANLYLDLKPGHVRIDPGATQDFTLKIYNFVPTAPGDLRATFRTTPGSAVEKVAAPEGWTCTIENGAADCRAAELNPFCRCSGNFTLTVRANSDRAGGESNRTAAAPTTHQQPAGRV
jgi:hypothetical protein